MKKVIVNNESLRLLKTTKEALFAASMAIGIYALEKGLEGITEPSAKEASVSLMGLKESLENLEKIYEELIDSATTTEEASSWS